QSKFCLCPRGRGPSTWRLYEALRAGRPPVIISDDWVPPAIDGGWEQCSIRVAERDVERIPEILREREPDAERMSAEARRVWQEWFSLETFFHRMADWCLALQARRTLAEHLARHTVW